MNNYEDWAILVAKKLKGEADLIAAIEKDELEDSAATDAFVRAVLEPFLPENYGIGSGRIVDAFGNYSDHLEVIIYNRDFPRIGMCGINDAYLYESVLATFSVRAKFIRKTFFESLDACASLAQAGHLGRWRTWCPGLSCPARPRPLLFAESSHGD